MPIIGGIALQTMIEEGKDRTDLKNLKDLFVEKYLLHEVSLNLLLLTVTFK